MSTLFSFPHPVNEKAARSVAGLVVVLAAVTLATGAWWLTVPRLGAPSYVSGPPKRFAQGMGATMSTAAAALAVTGAHTAAGVLLALLIAAATLESAFALCLGCKAFALLMRAGVVPDEVCAECTDIWSRPGNASA
jgi:hypothetical protein